MFYFSVECHAISLAIQYYIQMTQLMSFYSVECQYELIRYTINPLIPIDAYRHPRALGSSANDSVHAQGRFEKTWPAFGAPTHQNCVVGQTIATHATDFETLLMWACF